MFPTDVVIVAGARTPMTRYTGSFSGVSAIELAAHASKEAIRRSGVDPGEFDHSIFGNVMQSSADALYGAREGGLKAGVEGETPAVPDSRRACASGSETGKENDCSERGRSPAAGNDDGDSGETSAVIQERWDRHGGECQRDRGWRGRGCGDKRENREAAWIETCWAHCVLGGGGSRSQHHGNRTGAVVAEGVEASGTHAGADGPRGGE